MLRIVALLAASLATVLPAVADHPSRPGIVYAHRGGAAIAPENTLGAFRQAHALYGDRGVWLELDTHLAADAELVVIHDPTLDRTTTNCSGDVIALTSAELQVCDARAGWPDWPELEPVPTMRAVMTEGAAEGWRLMVELKNIPGEPNFDPTGEAAAVALLAVMQETGFPADSLIVQSSFPTSLDRIELLAPDVRTALLTTSQLPGAPPGGGFPALSNGLYATARGYEISAPDHRSIDLGPDVVAAMHALGREVVVWTPDAPDDIARALDAGVDGVISNDPERVYLALGWH
ncbi:MAG TPA: glycerophosphodiester phosphodiesterase [Actinomycetota bacterium]|jgi:glycerophosphoryl diester phosphodiesterase